MENTTPDNTRNNNVDALPPTQKAPATEPRKKTMTEAALAANRANAKKSTGPRTAAGKARSASNAFQHGLYSMKNYQHLVMHPNLVAATIHNLLEEYQPVTPTEHMLLQQLIHFQLRFLQSEHICNHYMLNDKHDAPDRAFLTVLRELDRIPNRILKTIKALKALIAERGTNKEIEPIDDPPPVPTPDEYQKLNGEYEKLNNEPIPPTHPSGPEITEHITEYIYKEFCKGLGITPEPITREPLATEPHP
jgi:hypothetical protein